LIIRVENIGIYSDSVKQAIKIHRIGFFRLSLYIKTNFDKGGDADPPAHGQLCFSPPAICGNQKISDNEFGGVRL
jgi:hypothetical protein